MRRDADGTRHPRQGPWRADMSDRAEYYRLAQEIMEPVVTIAGMRLGHAIEEIHITQIKPMRDESERLRAIRDELVPALEEAQGELAQFEVFLPNVNAALNKVRGEQT